VRGLLTIKTAKDLVLLLVLSNPLWRLLVQMRVRHLPHKNRLLLLRHHPRKYRMLLLSLLQSTVLGTSQTYHPQMQ
jgi:hypothetical protein